MKLLAAVMLGALAWAMARQLSVGGTGVGAKKGRRCGNCCSEAGG